MSESTDLKAALEIIQNAAKGDRGSDQQRIAITGIEWIALLLRKNADYGSSVWQTPILTPDADCDIAIRVRMSDKIQRLKSLLSGNEQQVKDESIEDTIKDLGAYCLLYLAKGDAA